MEITTSAFNGDFTAITTEALVVFVFESKDSEANEGNVLSPHGFPGENISDSNFGPIDIAMEGAITKLVNAKEITGKRGEVTIIHTLGTMSSDRIIVVGLGKEDHVSSEVLRRVMASVCRRLRSINVASISVYPGAINSHKLAFGHEADMDNFLQDIAEGAILGLYKFTKYFSKEDKDAEKNTIEVVCDESYFLDDAQSQIDTGIIIANSTMLARDMVNEPSNYMTPDHMAGVARRIALENGLDIQVFDLTQIQDMGMGGLLGVAKGSVEPPRFIVLSYNGDSASPENNLALVGKGITFDTGGISLKNPGGMMAMKGDMAGAASVISAIEAIAKLRLKINVTALVAATENMPSGSAQKPGDVLRTFGGKTVEVENTDAEGRLVLADAIGYARHIGLTRIIDVATLTGAIVSALGDVCTGAFTNDQELLSEVLGAGESTGEKIWQMPMFSEYKEQNKSQVADVKNTGGSKAGSITAAQFLSEFSEDTPWVHLDIAGTSTSDNISGYHTKGATGTPTRTLIQLASNLSRVHGD